MTLYRTTDEVGAFVDLTGDGREADLGRLQEDGAALESEIGDRLTFSRPPDSLPFRISARKALDTKDPATLDTQLDWLRGVGDCFVTAMRARFGAWAPAHRPPAC